MMAPQISDELIRWAMIAGYTFTPEDQSGAALFWTDPGGEMRYYIRSPAQDVYIVSATERALAEQVELYGTSMRAIERYLFGVFGSAIRSKRRLPRLLVPTRQEQLAPGFSLDEPDTEGFRSLFDSTGLVAKARGRVTSISTLTKLSHLLSAPLPDVQASYEDPNGRPLFTVRK